MKNLTLLTALAVALTLRAAATARASDGSTFSSTLNSGDNLFGYHVYGTDADPRGFVWDYGDNMPANLGWSLGLEPTHGDLYFYNYHYVTSPGSPPTLAASNLYLLRLRGDTGQMELGPSATLTHPNSGFQLGVSGGTATAPLGGAQIGVWGNLTNLYLSQNQTTPAVKRTSINFNGVYQMGTDSPVNNTADWWLWNAATSHFVLTANPDDLITIGYGLKHTGTTLGFYGNTPVTRPVVSGSRSDGTALRSLLQNLQALGLITDNSTP